jgi:hypothetical protein
LRFGQKSVDIRFVVFFCILRLGMSERKDSEFRRRVCEQLFAFAFPFFGLELDQKNLQGCESVRKSFTVTEETIA